jgi:hypothetical protein
MAYKLEPMGLRQIFEQSVSICKEHFGLLFKIMLLLLVPFYLVTGWIGIGIIPEMPAGGTPEQMQQAQEALLQSLLDHWLYLTIVTLVAFLVIYPVTGAAVIQAVARLYVGKPVTAVEALKLGFAQIGPLAWTGFLALLAIYAGLILFIIPGIYIAILFSLSQHVVVLERLSGPAALGRSKRLVRQNRLKCLALLLFIGVLSFAIGWGSQLIPQPHVRLVVNALVQAPMVIVWSVTFVVFYFSCRCGLEDFDLPQLAQAIDGKEIRAEPFV